MTTSTATPGLIIAGETVTTSRTFSVINPFSGAPFAEAPECTPAQLDQAFIAAQQAMLTWKADPEARRSIFRQAVAELSAAVGEIAPLVVAEQGKPHHEAVQEVELAVAWLSYFAELESPAEVIQDDSAAYVEIVHRPVGVVAAITPWNFPVSLASWKIGPALAAGCTMVLKPSPYTPLSTLKLGEVLNRALPAGVLNVVTGSDPLGALMTAHAIPRKVSFTGSLRTGMRVAEAAAPDLKRITLELGGNDPAILLDDVDPTEIAQQLFWSGFTNAGQICCAVKRVYAPAPLYDAVVEALVDQARQVVLGDGCTKGTTMGPINNLPQLKRVQGLVADAVAQGAVAVTGGSHVGSGYLYQPTILAGADDGMAIVDEEQFGPVLPVIAYRDIEDALSRANHSAFGLGGSVWGRDEARATLVAERLESGTAWVNTHLALSPHQPFGGLKSSGVGVENGRAGFHEFTDTQVIHRARRRAAETV